MAMYALSKRDLEPTVIILWQTLVHRCAYQIVMVVIKEMVSKTGLCCQLPSAARHGTVNFIHMY